MKFKLFMIFLFGCLSVMAQDANTTKDGGAFRHHHFVRYFNFMPISYMHATYSTKTYSDPYAYYGIEQRNKLEVVGGGFRIGGSIFFNRGTENKKFKVGMDILFVSFTAGLDFSDPSTGLIYFSLGQPGIIFKYYHNDYSGFNFRFNIGSSFSVATVGAVSLGTQCRLSYWFKNFSIGLEYRNVRGIEDNGDIDGYDLNINHIGLNCGFHF